MKHANLPDYLYLKATRCGVTFRKRTSSRPTYYDLVVGLRIWAKKFEIQTSEISKAYACSVIVLLPDGVRMGNAVGFSINKVSKGKEPKQIVKCQKSAIAHALNIIYSCISKK